MPRVTDLEVSLPQIGGEISSSTYPTHRCTSPRLPRTSTRLTPPSSVVSAASSSITTPPGALTLAASPASGSLTPPLAAVTPIVVENCSASRSISLYGITSTRTQAATCFL
ncbi:hypothetical protein U1Q18_032463 [Sarracenia purpurea var. burkii]